MKHLEERLGKKLSGLVLHKDFSDVTYKAQSVTGRSSNWTSSEWKTSERMKTSYRLRGKSLQIMYVKYLYQEYKTQSSIIRKPIFKNGQKICRDTSLVVSNSLQPHGL